MDDAHLPDEHDHQLADVDARADGSRGLTDNGLPVELEILARRYDEQPIFRVGYGFEQGGSAPGAAEAGRDVMSKS